MSIVWFVLQEPFASLWRGFKRESWEKLCATLFGFSDEDLQWMKPLNSCVTQQNINVHVSLKHLLIIKIYFLETSLQLKGLFLRLSCLFGLPMSRLHVCDTYAAKTPILP
jgi:hypothetical protein